MQHHVDRFYAAVAVLAGDGHIKQRLISAYQENIAGISEDEFPRDLKPNLIELKNELNRVEPHNGEGAVCASVRKMSVDEASRCAGMVLAIYAELARLRAIVEDALPLGMDIAAETETGSPPYLLKTAG